MKKLRRFAAAVVLAGALTVIPVIAQESAPRSAETSEKPGMELWKWLNFALLGGVLWYLITKNLGPMLTDRSTEIRDGLAAGEKAKAEAEARAAAVQVRLAGLDKAVAEMRASAREDREREMARIRRDTELEFARIEQHAAQEIESAGKLARLEVQREAARLAIDLAERKVRARMSSDAQSDLFNNFLGDLAQESAKPRTT